MLLRRNSVQALFNGYYHDDNIAAINLKNPSRQIEEHVPSSNQSTPSSGSMAQSVAPGTNTHVEGSANSATNSNINTLHQSMHQNMALQKQNEMGTPSVVNHYNSMSGSTNKREVESSGYADRLSKSKTSGHQFSNSMVLSQHLQ